jgi:TubC N-terminal docking domain
MIAAQTLLERFASRGIELVAAGNSLRFRPANLVTAEEQDTLRAHKSDLLRLLAYRDALLASWRLTLNGERANRDDCRRAIDDVARHIDEIGLPLADVLRHKWERQWIQSTGSCPRCGTRDANHT